MLGTTSNSVLKDFFGTQLILRYLNVEKQSGFDELMSELIYMNNEQNLVIFSNLQHINLWKEGKKFLRKLVYNNFSRKFFRDLKNKIIGENEYTCIHWRRGDFEIACKKNKNYSECYPEVSMIFKKAKYTTVLVATNEKSIINMKMITDDFTLIRDFHTSDPILNFLIDVYFMINSAQFIGNKYSSISRNVVVIRDLLDKPSEFF